MEASGLTQLSLRNTDPLTMKGIRRESLTGNLYEIGLKSSKNIEQYFIESTPHI